MFFETFFSIKCTPLRHSRFRIKIPDFYQFLFSSLRNTPPWKIFYRVRSTSSFLLFRKRQPSKNMEERSVKIKLSFLTPLCGHTHTFLRIPLSKNLENSHGSALLWFRSPLLKPEKIPPPSLAPSISPFPRDSFGEKNKKKERREREQAVVVISSCSTGKPLHSNEDPIVKNDRLFVPPSLSLFCIGFVPSRGT